MTVNITATITDTTGDAVVGARVNAKLFVPDVLSDFVVPEDSNVTGTTDANGQAVLALWPNSSNTDINTYYRVRAWDPTTKAKIMDVCAYVDTAANLEDIAYSCRTASDDDGGTAESAALASHVANANDPHATAGYKKWKVLELDVSDDFTYDAGNGTHTYTLDVAAGEHEYSLIFIADALAVVEEAVAEEIILVVPDVNATYMIGGSFDVSIASLTIQDSFDDFDIDLYTPSATQDDGVQWTPVTRLGNGNFYSTVKYERGTFGTLYADSAVFPVTSWRPFGSSTSLLLMEMSSTIEMSSAYANTVNVPPHTSVDFPYGYSVNILQYGAGQTSIVAGSGVTIRTAKSTTLRAQYSIATLVCRGYSEWYLYGDLATE